MTDPLPIGFHDPISDPEIEYRAVEPLAVMALVVGLLAPMALLDLAWWIVPILGIAISFLALRRLSADAGRTGRVAAHCGLALSVFFILMAGMRLVSVAALLSPQARPIAQQWFEFLREGQPEKALMMTYPPDRQVYDEDGLWRLYRSDHDARERLEIFVKNPLVRVVMALGDKADVRYFSTESLAARSEGARAQAVYVYSITYPDADGKKKTFFARIALVREPTQRSWISPWHVDTFDGGVRPSGQASGG